MGQSLDPTFAWFHLTFDLCLWVRRVWCQHREAFSQSYNPPGPLAQGHERLSGNSQPFHGWRNLQPAWRASGDPLSVGDHQRSSAQWLVHGHRQTCLQESCGCSGTSDTVEVDHSRAEGVRVFSRTMAYAGSVTLFVHIGFIHTRHLDITDTLDMFV